MDTVLLTGATGFLGYHVAKKLNAAGIRPRVLELREGRQDLLNQLDVHRCAGYLEDAGAVRSACSGVNTLLHLAFKVSVGSGTKLAEEMQRINIEVLVICWKLLPPVASSASLSQAARSASA